MGTFQRTETIDARQFTGGEEDGLAIALWVNSNGQATETRAAYHKPSKPIPERVKVYNYGCRSGFVAYPQDWVIRNQDGSFETLRPEAFVEAGFKQV